MHEVIVVGPYDGLYHIGYQSDTSNTFYSISEFVNPVLAQAIAEKMNREREANDGR